MSYYKIRPRSGTATQWATANPVLAEREIGYEVPETGFGTGPVRMKMGDGVTPWNNLAYADPETGGGSGEDCLTKADIVNNSETDDPTKVASASALYNTKKELSDSLQGLFIDYTTKNDVMTKDNGITSYTLTENTFVQFNVNLNASCNIGLKVNDVAVCFLSESAIAITFSPILCKKGDVITVDITYGTPFDWSVSLFNGC